MDQAHGGTRMRGDSMVLETKNKDDELDKILDIIIKAIKENLDGVQPLQKQNSFWNKPDGTVLRNRENRGEKMSDEKRCFVNSAKRTMGFKTSDRRDRK